MFPGDSTRPNRRTSLPGYLNDSVITDFVPQRNNNNLRSIVTNCIDRMEEDFNRRFSSENTAIWSALEYLVPSSYTTFLDYTLIAPLFSWATTIPAVKQRFIQEQLTTTNLEAECRVFSRILGKEYEAGSFEHDTRKGTIDILKVAIYMARNHRETAPVLTTLYRLAITIGYSSARCECVFSSLSKIDAPQRRKQSTKRETNLTFLHFERKTLMNIKFDDFLKVWESKPRKLSFV